MFVALQSVCLVQPTESVLQHAPLIFLLCKLLLAFSLYNGHCASQVDVFGDFVTVAYF